jgi:hypothetical protein
VGRIFQDLAAGPSPTQAHAAADRMFGLDRFPDLFGFPRLWERQPGCVRTRNGEPAGSLVTRFPEVIGVRQVAAIGAQDKLRNRKPTSISRGC